MAESHSGWSRTAQGTRANSQDRPAKTRTIAGARVDIDGVPLSHTTRSGVVMPDKFYEDFRKDPVAAFAMWTADEA